MQKYQRINKSGRIKNSTLFIVLLVATQTTLTGCVGSVVKGISSTIDYARTDPKRCDKLVIGKTTAEETEQLFGVADGVIPEKDGTKTRDYSRGNLRVQIVFDENGIVKDVKRCGKDQKS